MKKRISILTLIFLFTAFLIAITPTYAQTTDGTTDQPGSSPGANPQQWKCASNRHPNQNEASIIPEGTPLSPRDIANHRRTISLTGLDSMSCYYIVGCVDSSNGIMCTSGDSSHDETLGLTHEGEPNATYLRTSQETPFPYWFYVQGGSKKCNPKGGNINVVVTSATVTTTNHTFFAVRMLSGSQINRGSDQDTWTLTYGTLQFAGGADNCAGWTADPTGVVFDTQSLEPIGGVTLTIKDATTKQPVQFPGIEHTKKTLDDGRFTWLVEDGTYTIDVVSLPAGFSYSSDVSIHPNYNKAYTNLLFPGDVVTEKGGVLVVADIPVASSLPYRADPKILRYKVIQTGPHLLVSGANTHPFTKIVASQDGIEIGQIAANKYGFFALELPNSTINPSKKIDFTLEKVDLTQDETSTPQTMPTDEPSEMNPETQNPFQSLIDLIVKPAYAQESALSIEPIPTYLEGYAKTASGVVIPNATIAIKLTMSDALYFQTKADENGYFSITPEFLPIINYYLEFSDPTGLSKPITQTITQYATANKDWIETNRIDIMKGTKNGTPVINIPTQAPEEEPEQLPGQMGGTQGTENGANQQQDAIRTNPQSNMYLIVIAIFVLVIVAIAITFYMKNKKGEGESSSDDMIPPTPQPTETPQAPIS